MKLARISIYKFFKRFREHSCRLCMECQLEPMDNKQTKKGSAEFIFCCSNISKNQTAAFHCSCQSECASFTHMPHAAKIPTYISPSNNATK